MGRGEVVDGMCCRAIMTVCFSRLCACSTLKKHVETSVWPRRERDLNLPERLSPHNITRGFSNCEGSSTSVADVCGRMTGHFPPRTPNPFPRKLPTWTSAPGNGLDWRGQMSRGQIPRRQRPLPIRF